MNLVLCYCVHCLLLDILQNTSPVKTAKKQFSLCYIKTGDKPLQLKVKERTKRPAGMIVLVSGLLPKYLSAMKPDCMLGEFCSSDLAQVPRNSL